MRGGSDLKQHNFQKLSQSTIADAIMYLEARFAGLEMLVSVVPWHEKMALSSSSIEKYKREFQKLVISTTGLITWPSALINELEKDVGDAQHDVRPCTLAFLALLIAISAITYYILTLESLWVWLIAVPPFGFSLIYVYIMFLFQTTHLFGFNRIHDIKKSDSIQLEDTIGAIFDLLQTEFSTPLRLYVIGDYSQLIYTGRTKTSDTLVRLKEAILYPKLT
jgi:hypothetical protein